ncbi:hypothetical protein pdam_00013908 [Pocillopora damicornis]|uniref:Band 7 domain-containing protein n=1 Tax=Pocillopora damicornis TaxID=46731 RepID=A0A3M6UBG8_POCDA|nr:uncharacterized protein LOC113666251 [Pocillopora damicornis]RMX50992.1 hypothetical protein pdam_00013908 [Pocillopora damicornis]
MASATPTIIAAVVGIVALLIVILIPTSFSSVEYYELGFKRRKSTGFVDISEVYTSGRYFVGPDYTFKVFPADAHFVELDEISVWTGDKIEIKISCNFQYFLRKDFLPDLHEAYNVDYKPVVRGTAIDAIKGRAADLPIDDYIRNRENIEKELFKALAKRVDGCCRETCPTDEEEMPACGYCIKNSLCEDDERGMFVEVRYFQLLAVDVHEDVKSRYLRQVTEAAEEERAQFELREKVVRKETERIKNKIYNEAREIAQNASAKAVVIDAEAKAKALRVVEEARSEGLKNLYSELGITTDEEKAAFNYLRSLRQNKNVKLNVGYKSLAQFQN